MIDLAAVRSSCVEDDVQRLDELAAEVADARRQVDALRHADGRTLRYLVDRLALLLTRAEVRLARLHFATCDSWEEEADAFDELAATLRRLLDILRADLAAARADEPSTFRRAVRHQVDAWHGFLDDLALRCHLAGLDIRDDLDRARSTLRDVRHRHRQAPVSGGWTPLRAELTLSMDDVRTRAVTLLNRLPTL